MKDQINDLIKQAVEQAKDPSIRTAFLDITIGALRTAADNLAEHERALAARALARDPKPPLRRPDDVAPEPRSPNKFQL